MKILGSLKQIIKRIYIIDRKAKRLFQGNRYSSNPFVFTQNRTYVWLEKIDNYNNCPNENEHKKST